MAKKNNKSTDYYIKRRDGTLVKIDSPVDIIKTIAEKGWNFAKDNWGKINDNITNVAESVVSKAADKISNIDIDAAVDTVSDVKQKIVDKVRPKIETLLDTPVVQTFRHQENPLPETTNWNAIFKNIIDLHSGENDGVTSEPISELTHTIKPEEKYQIITSGGANTHDVGQLFSFLQELNQWKDKKEKEQVNNKKSKNDTYSYIPITFKD